MAFKSVHTNYLDQLPQNAKPSFPKGHRGRGMNMANEHYYWSDGKIKGIKENSIKSFNSAAKFRIQFVEFDVQVTKDDCPVIFHDDLILTQDQLGVIIEKRISDITLVEFLSYGPQKVPGTIGKPLWRKTKDGRIFEWKVEIDDSLCTLKEAFQNVELSLGFKIELKFNDHIIYTEEPLTHILQTFLKVFFLTKGGTEVYSDVRRNSLEEAIKVCLQGIVSEVKALLRNQIRAITTINNSKLNLITYGQLNNVAEVVYMQHLMGVDGVIVDHVREITDYICPAKECHDNNISSIVEKIRTHCSSGLIPELIYH